MQEHIKTHPADALATYISEKCSGARRLIPDSEWQTLEQQEAKGEELKWTRGETHRE
jgi:hypothetical protein